MKNIADAIHTEYKNKIDGLDLASEIMHKAIMSGFTNKHKRKAIRELRKLLLKYRLEMHYIDIEEIENTINNLEECVN